MNFSEERPGEVTEAGPAVEPTTEKGPMGIGATFAVSLGIWVLSQVMDFFVLFLVTVVEAVKTPGLADTAFLSRPDTQGLLMSLATCVTMPVSTALVLVIVKLNRGPSLSDYMAFRDVPWSRVLGWVGITVVFGTVASLVTAALDRPIPGFIISVYEGAYFYPVLWIGLVACAPVYEEVFFRGFMFKGIAASRLRPVGAVVLTSLVWSGAHFQYELFELGMLIVFGIVLGIARLRTRSVLPCIAMHTVFNLFAVIEVMAALGMGSRLG